MHGSAVSGDFPEGSRPAVVALGANLGDRAGTLRAALAELEARGNVLIACSPFHETAPVGYLDQPDFINATALFGVPAGVSPEAFLAELLDVEKKFGRVRTFPNAPRTLDLDLIFFADETRDSPGLTLPHPRWRERAFVVEPLAEMLAALGDRVPACVAERVRDLNFSTRKS